MQTERSHSFTTTADTVTIPATSESGTGVEMGERLVKSTRLAKSTGVLSLAVGTHANSSSISSHQHPTSVSVSVNVTRKSQYHYGAASKADASLVTACLRTHSAPLLLSDKDSLLPFHTTDTKATSHTTSGFTWMGQRIAGVARRFRRQAAFEKAVWIIALFACALQILGLLIYARTHILTPADRWLNTVYHSDPLSPRLATLHAVLSLVFIAGIAPLIFSLHSSWHSIHPHAPLSSSLVPFNIFWACIPVLAISSIPPMAADFYHMDRTARFSITPRLVMLATTIYGCLFLYIVRVHAKRIVMQHVSIPRVQKRRSSSFLSNGMAGGSNSLGSVNIGTGAKGTDTNISSNVSTTNGWVKKMGTSFEAHVGVLGLICGGWGLGFLESLFSQSSTATSNDAIAWSTGSAAYLNSTKTTISAASAVLAAPGAFSTTSPYDKTAPKIFIIPVVYVIIQTCVSVILMYWGAFGHGVKYLPPATQQFNVSRRFLIRSLSDIAHYASIPEECGSNSSKVMRNSRNNKCCRHAKTWSLPSPPVTAAIIIPATTIPVDECEDGDNGTTGSQRTSLDSVDSMTPMVVAENSNSATADNSYDTASITSFDSGDNASSSSRRLIKSKRSSSFATATIETALFGTRDAFSWKRNGLADSLTAANAVGKFQRLAFAMIAIVGSLVTGLVFAWLFVCVDSCGRGYN
ncbi:hypothetical protein HK100_001949 [Physocladia obscura]|uniref:Uncharacterized protein n=1 Tax=Physocladia obscura TaxID=109957 RepID=A0AAD5SW18_9FUNG|nr:hypothetical protein HK100_001949 [Physocladia obscura]